MPRTAAVADAADTTAHTLCATVVELRPRTRRTLARTGPATPPAAAAVTASVTTLPLPAPVDVEDDGDDDDPLAGREASPPQGTVRIQLTDGRVLWGTMIRDYRPTFTEEDYAALARCRDELRAHAATRRTLAAVGLPKAA